jgi:5-methylcytosine-specific restriction endonuclease McrA
MSVAQCATGHLPATTYCGMKSRRFDCAEYQELHRRVLKRDDWRCQLCGAQTQLQVHHLQSRAQFGADVEDNLFTVCAACHRAIHLKEIKGSVLP